MAIEKRFIQKALDDLTVKDFLFKELDKSGVSSIAIQRTPIATRITARVRKPGMVVGKKGKAIKDICDELSRRFGIENPQFEVVEVMKPELDAKLVAEKIGHRIELRPNIKPVMRMALREVMEAGALGVEIQVAGKIVGKGGKAKTVRVRSGYLKKSGEPVKMVSKGHYVAYLKAGAVGISVSIVPPNIVFPDSIKVPKAGEFTFKETVAEETAEVAETKEEPAEKKEKPATAAPKKKAAQKKKKEKTEEGKAEPTGNPEGKEKNRPEPEATKTTAAKDAQTAPATEATTEAQATEAATPDAPAAPYETAQAGKQ